MYSVHNDTLASSSRHVIDDYWSVSLGTCSFPTSDLRSVDRWCTTTPPISLIPPPRNFTLSDGFAPLNRSVSRYSNIVPRRTQIRLGVWSDGCNQVISAACPDVQAFLTCAREDMTLPVAPSERVFALAALEVFYRVDDPVHWMFWNEKKKDETAEVVNRISLHRPPLIQSRVAWNGVSEYLFILAGLHGPTSSPLYEDKDWYPILNPPKAASPPRMPNLRKRKPQQAELRETPGGVVDQEGIDEEEPPAKKPKTKRTSHSKKSQRSKDVNNPVTIDRHTDISPAISSISPPRDLDNVLILAEVPVEDPPPLATRVLARKPKLNAPQTSPTPASSTHTALSDGPASAFATSPPHSRNRSTSRTSSQTSSQTLVAERRSASVVSALTTVDVPIVGKEEMLESRGGQAADDTPESEGKPDSGSGMVTRGRASKARTTGGQVKTCTGSRPKRKAKRNAK